MFTFYDEITEDSFTLTENSILTAEVQIGFEEHNFVCIECPSYDKKHNFNVTYQFSSRHPV
jgi:hypothetical protein